MIGGKLSQELSQLAQSAGWPDTKFSRAVLETAAVFLGHNATHLQLPEHVRVEYLDIAALLLTISEAPMVSEEA